MALAAKTKLETTSSATTEEEEVRHPQRQPHLKFFLPREIKEDDLAGNRKKEDGQLRRTTARTKTTWNNCGIWIWIKKGGESRTRHRRRGRLRRVRVAYLRCKSTMKKSWRLLKSRSSRMRGCRVDKNLVQKWTLSRSCRMRGCRAAKNSVQKWTLRCVRCSNKTKKLWHDGQTAALVNLCQCGQTKIFVKELLSVRN